MPIRTYKTDGSTLIFDSDLITAGVCLGTYLLPANSAGSLSWSLLAGATVRVAGAYMVGKTSRVVSASAEPTISGYIPTMSWGSVAYARQVLVWATGTPAVISGAGMQALNASQNVALSPQARGLVYIGAASYVSQTPTTTTGINDLGNWWIQVQSQTQPIGVVDMSGGVLVQASPVFSLVSGTTWQATISAVSARATTSVPTALATPTVYCFAVPPAPSSGIRAAIYDTDGVTLAYDLLAGTPLATVSSVSISASELTATNPPSVTRSLPSAGRYGLIGGVPYYRLRQRTTNSSLTFQGFWQVSGTTLYAIDSLTELDTDSGTVTATIAASTATAEIIDLSRYI